MKSRYFLIAACFTAFGCSTTGVNKIEATNDLIIKVCGQQPLQTQPKIDIYLTQTGDWSHGSVRCTKVTGVSPDNVVIPILPVPVAPPEKPIALILFKHESGASQVFPNTLAGMLAKLEGGKEVRYVRDDPRTPGIHYTAYIY